MGRLQWQNRCQKEETITRFLESALSYYQSQSPIASSNSERRTSQTGKPSPETKNLLKNLLSTFHQVLAVSPYPSLLYSVLCASLPLPSPAITQRVIVNCLTISSDDADSHAISCLLRMIPCGDNWNAAWDTVTQRLFKGFEGNQADVKRSFRLLCSVAEGCTNPSIRGEFILTTFQRFIRSDLSVHRTINECVQQFVSCAHMLQTDWIHKLLFLCQQTLQSATSPHIIVHTLDVLLSFSSQSSFFVVFAPLLLNLLYHQLAAFNRDHFVHARLLRMLAMPLPLLDLQTVDSPTTWLYDKCREMKDILETERSSLMSFIHRSSTLRLFRRVRCLLTSLPALSSPATVGLYSGSDP